MTDNLVDTEENIVSYLRSNLTEYTKRDSSKNWIWYGAPQLDPKTKKLISTPRINVMRVGGSPVYTRLGTHKKDYHISYQISVYVAGGQNGYVSGTGTTLTEDVDTSETAIDVTSAANMTAGSYIRITDGTNEDIRKISSIATNTVTVDGACNNTYSIGDDAYPYSQYAGVKLLNKICDDIANTLESGAGSVTGIYSMERIDEGGYFFDPDLAVYVCPMMYEAWVINR